MYNSSVDLEIQGSRLKNQSSFKTQASAFVLNLASSWASKEGKERPQTETDLSKIIAQCQQKDVCLAEL